MNDAKSPIDSLKVTYSIKCLPEDTPVRGNIGASGDSALDKAIENEILARLERGEQWAWCYVEVVASVLFNGQTFTGSDFLSGCSYKDEADFATEDGYYPQMRDEALNALKVNLAHAVKRGEAAALALKALTR